MTSVSTLRALAVVTLGLLVCTQRTAEAQSCRGMPRGGGLAFAMGDQFLGSSYGVAASKGPIAVGFNTLSSESEISAWDANVRFTLAMGASRLQFCPSLGIDYQNQSVPVFDGSELTVRHATAGAGVGVSYQFDATRGISITPFLAGDYHFSGIMFSLSDEDAEDELSGDTLSFVNLQYGGVVQYKTFFAAFVADRSLANDGGLYRTRLMLGISLGGGGGSSSRRRQ